MRHCYILRVFTMGTTGGNPLGVVPDSTGLADDDMQRIAAELGFSETVFLEWGPDDVPFLRIFTPTVELPFAGHPLVGTAWLLNHLGPGSARLKIAIGVVEIDMRNHLVFVRPPGQDRSAHEIGIAEVTDLGVAATRAWRTAVPQEYLVIQLASERDLVAAQPDLAAAAGLADGIYLVVDGSPCRTRFFAPGLGVSEDPATGSAAVALAAVRRALGETSGSVQVVQGLPEWLSEIRLEWSNAGAAIGGTVVKDEIRLLDD